MSNPTKVLVVLTSHSQLGDTGKETGWYLSELAHPYDVFTREGLTLTLASPKGGKAPLDPASIDAAKDFSSQTFFRDQSHLWEKTERLSSFLGRAKDFAAVFYPGGHGPMFDLASDRTSQDLIAEFAREGKVVAAVCHGPGALVNVDGGGFLKGKRVTGFSNAEEEAMGFEGAVPFSLEDRLKEAVGEEGAYEKAEEKWAAKVVVDGKLITGQNPASANGVAEAIVQAVQGL